MARRKNFITDAVLFFASFGNIIEGTYHLFKGTPKIIEGVIIVFCGLLILMAMLTRKKNYLLIYLILNVPSVILIPIAENVSRVREVSFWGMVVIQYCVYKAYNDNYLRYRRK